MIKSKMNDVFYKLLEELSQKWIKRVLWVKDKMIPFVGNVVLFMLVLWMVQRIYYRVGFEQTVILEVAIGVFLLRMALKSK